jgi:hypothetical protein
MKTWQDWKVGTRLGVLFGSLLLVLSILGAWELNWLGRLNASTTAELQSRLKHHRELDR